MQPNDTNRAPHELVEWLRMAASICKETVQVSYFHFLALWNTLSGAFERKTSGIVTIKQPTLDQISFILALNLC